MGHHELSFASRLRDVLATLESVALLRASDRRVRGLAEQLELACLALPCDEALVAVEVERLGRLRVPGIATAEAFRHTELELSPSGTPFAFLLGGGGGHAAELVPHDPMLAALAGHLESEPRQGIFVPLRLGSAVVGGAAFLRTERTLGDRELMMAERLAEALSVTLEAFRTERVLLELFAAVLPELCADDAGTRFTAGLERFVHALRMAPSYRLQLELAAGVAKLAGRGANEARLARDVLARVEAYVAALAVGADDDDDAGSLVSS